MLFCNKNRTQTDCNWRLILNTKQAEEWTKSKHTKIGQGKINGNTLNVGCEYVVHKPKHEGFITEPFK